MPALVLMLFHFSFCFQISQIVFTIKLSIYTFKTLATHYFAFPLLFFKNSYNLDVMYCTLSLFVSLFSFDCFNPSTTFTAVLIVEFIYYYYLN